MNDFALLSLPIIVAAAGWAFAIWRVQWNAKRRQTVKAAHGLPASEQMADLV